MCIRFVYLSNYGADVQRMQCARKLCCHDIAQKAFLCGDAMPQVKLLVWCCTSTVCKHMRRLITVTVHILAA